VVYSKGGFPALPFFFLGFYIVRFALLRGSGFGVVGVGIENWVMRMAASLGR
jgi:hypothetical protein